MKKWLPWVIGFGVLINLLLSFYQTDYQQLRTDARFQSVYLLLAAVLALLPWLWHSVRLWLWARFLERPVSLPDIVKIVVATDLGAAVTPTFVGGGPIKIGMLMQKGFSSGEATTLVALSGLEDTLFFAVIMPLLFLFFYQGNTDFATNLISQASVNPNKIILFVTLIIVVFFIFKKLKQSQKGIHTLLPDRWKRGWLRLLVKGRQSLRDFQTTWRMIWKDGQKTFFMSVILLAIQWSCRLCVLLALVTSLGIEVNLFHLFLYQWVVIVSMLFVPTPGATGGAEAVFFYIFSSILPASLIGLVVAGWRFLTYYFVMLMALLILGVMNVRANPRK